MSEPWTAVGVIIAKPGYTWVTRWEEGKNHTVCKFYDENSDLVALYADIGSAVRKSATGTFEFEDWYLDVFQPVGQKPMLLDEDELAEAVKLGYLSNEQAKSAEEEAEHLMKELADHTPEF